MTTTTPTHVASAAIPSATDTIPRDLSAVELAELFELSTDDIHLGSTDVVSPRMAPPGAELAHVGAAVASAAVAISGQHVTALWAEQSNRNAWAYLETAGWKRLNPLTDSGSTALTLLAAHARSTGSAPYVDENPAGTISVMYVW